MKNKIFNFLASGFYVSLLPATLLKGHKNTGAGLLGTLVAVPLAWFFMPEVWWAQIIFLLAFMVFSIWVTKNATFEGHDNPKIVIDEIAGYFFALAFMPKNILFYGAAFILFRLFDWLKPGPIKKLDKMKTPASIVLDDVASGIVANICVWILLIVLYFWDTRGF
ncbi:phosphatidylglycerophosphatase A [Elusimicrobium simillimum]|uniref:phosphatidylglycerophosphatase A family protein n=1 Tax=Elusimicrobium simillimum TaxID=3143438 RepID=UPI003C6F342F